MTPPAPPVEPDSDQRSLQQLIIWFIAFLCAFSVVEIAAFLYYGDPRMGVATLVVASFIAILLLARAWVRRGRVQGAAYLIAISSWAVGIIGVLIQPAYLPTLAIVPLIAVALLLRYLRGPALRWLILACWGVTVLIAILGETLKRPESLPPWLLSLLRVGSLAGALAIILLLLWQFSQQLRANLAQVRAAYSALQASEARLRAIIAQAPVILFVIDKTGTFTLFDGRGLSALGRRPEDFVGRSALEFFASSYPEGVGRLQRALAGETVHWSGPVGERYYEVSLTPLRDADGEVQDVIGLALDLTERVRIETQLQVVISAIPIILFAADQNGRITLSAGKGLAGLGLRTGELVGQSALAFRPEVPAIQEIIRLALAGEEVREIVELDGKVFEFRLSPQHDFQGHPTGYLGVALDITERKQLEAQLWQARKLESIGRLAGGVAHDFNNLLTAIVGHAELARTSVAPGSELAADLGLILRAADRASRLVRQLLAFARRQPIAPQILNLNELIDEMGALVRRLIGEDIILTNQLAEGLWPIQADPGQIEQVLMNLFVNARDAMPDGGQLTVTTRNVELDAHDALAVDLAPGAYISVMIRDTGEGMSPEVLDHIFEPFFTTKPPDRGTGLGLATSYGIIMQHQGQITVASQVGRGTTVTIYLPAAASMRYETANLAVATVAPMGTETVLLVEDEAAVRALAARVLRGHGYTVLEAAHGAEALRLAAQADPAPIHLLLTDVIMPHMSGPQVAAQIGARYPGIKVIFMSGHSETMLVNQGRLEQEHHLLHKPFSPAQLAQLVRAALDGELPPASN